jgi:uncharacterized protein (DUF1786 family)
LSWAIRDHALAGFPVTAEPHAALTLHDNPDHVRKMGIVIQEKAPQDAMSVHLADIQRDLLEETLARFDMEPPDLWCVAVQDHGHQPHGSNRAFRFTHWSAFLSAGGDLVHTIHDDPPLYFTRMRSVLNQVPSGLVMDTGMAAVHGAMCDPWVRSRLERGVTVVNLGNQHTLAALVAGERIWGMFEHHTGALSTASLARWIQRFRRGELTSDEVLEDGGHGCAYHPGGLGTLGFDAVAVTGPQRAMARTLDWTLAAPCGNMMLSGCFGLVRAFLLTRGVAWP